MVQVVEYNTLDELASLRPVWNRLLAQTPGATFFQSFDWLKNYSEFFGRERQLRVLVVEEAGEPIGILPLAVAVETSRVGRVRVLGYPLAGWGSFYGPIGTRPAEILEAGLAHIQATPHDWDLLDLRWVDADIDRNATPNAFCQVGFNFDARVWHTSAQVELDRGWEHYWTSRTSRWRNNVRRTERLLGNRGSVEHVRYRPRGEEHRDIDPRWDVYDSCVRLAQQSWQGASTSGTTLSHDSVRDYLRSARKCRAGRGGRFESAALKWAAGCVCLQLLLPRLGVWRAVGL